MTEADLQNQLDALTKLLVPMGSPKRALAAQNDKSTRYDCLAIRVPVLRQVALRDFALKEHSPRDRLAIHNHIWNHGAYYEVMSIPILYYYAQARKHKLERFQFETIQHWVERVDDWGHADGLGGILSFFNAQYSADVFPFLKRLNGLPDLWSIRVSIVSLVHYSGKNAVYLSPEEAFPLLEPHLGRREKYIANAIGWVLREYGRKNPEATRAFVEANEDAVSPVAMRRYKSA